MRYLLVATVVLVSACSAKAVKTEQTENSDVKLELMFTSPEGCRVYRFGGDHYFAACGGGTVMETHQQTIYVPVGKILVPQTRHWTEEVPTVSVGP